MKTLDGMPGTMMTLKCETGHEWSRPSKRGRPPRFCPECAAKHKAEMEAKAEARAVENKSAQPDPEAADRMAIARAKKAERAEERAKNEAREQEEVRQRILRQLPNLHNLWNRAFTIAVETDNQAAWNNCERLMTNYVNAKRAVNK